MWARVVSISRSYCTPDGHAGTHAMQPRHRSKCSTTVSVSGDRAVDEAAHQVDAAARRVHLLVPERVGRARGQAEAAVDAVGDQLGLHGPREAPPRRARRAGSRSRRGSPLDVGDARARAARAAPAPPSQRTRPGRPACSARTSAHGSAVLAAELRRLRLHGSRAALEEHEHLARRRCRPRSARARSGAGSASGRAPTRDRALRGGQRVQAQRERARRCRAGRASRRRACRGRSPRRSSRPCRPSSRACRRAARR